MARERISTTVDAGRLAEARARSDLRDSELFDRALELVVRQMMIEAEIDALDRFPYELDPDLNMGTAPGDPADELPYDGVVPEQVLRLAEQRRAERVRRAS